MSERFSHVLNVIAEDATRSRPNCVGSARPSGCRPAVPSTLRVAGDVQAALAEACSVGANADINLVASAQRRKKLLVADMDSTIIGCECLDELADMAGLKPQVVRHHRTRDAGRNRIRGRPCANAWRFSRACRLRRWNEPTRSACGSIPAPEALVATMRAHGAQTCLVSGGFTFFTSRVAALAGFDDQQATHCSTMARRSPAQVAEPILGREAKLAALEEETAAIGISTSPTRSPWATAPTIST